MSDYYSYLSYATDEAEDNNEPARNSAYTYRKEDRKLNTKAVVDEVDQKLVDEIEELDRQIGRLPDELPPPDDNDLLQLESRLNSTQPEDADYEQYFDYLYKDGKPSHT